MRRMTLVQRHPAATVESVRSFRRFPLAKVGVWLLLLVVVAVGAVLASPQGQPPQGGFSQASAQPADSPRASAGESFSARAMPLEEGGYTSSSAETLPAFKWSAVQLEQDETINAVDNLFVTIPLLSGSILLAIANFLWLILLWVLRFALGADELLTFAAGPINAGVATVGGVLLFLAVPLFVFVSWKAIKAFISPGKGAGGFMILGKGILLMALLMVVVNASTTAAKGYDPAALAALEQAVNDCQAQAAADTGDLPSSVVYDECIKTATVVVDGVTTPVATVNTELTSQIDAAGTVPWFAKTVGTAASTVTGYAARFSDGFAETAARDNQEIAPNCVSYIRRMHEAYLEGDGDPTLSVVSKLWESTLYRSWMAMAFGEPQGEYDLPSMSMCRYAERVNGTSAEEQAAIQRAATPEIDIKGPVFTAHKWASPLRPGRNANLAMTAWVACTYDGGWKVSPAFAGAGDEEFQAKLAEDCTSIFTTGVPTDNAGSAADYLKDFGLWRLKCLIPACAGDITPPTPADAQDVPLAELYSKYDQYLVSINPDTDATLAPAREWMEAYKGMSGGSQLLHGLLALAVAIVMLITMGGLALGLFVAQFMLLVMLMLVPVILIMWVIGMDRKAGQLARVTFTLMVSQVFFIALLSIIIVLSRVFQQMSGVVLGPVPGADIVRTILLGASPIIAFFVVKKIAMMLGLGNIMKFSGALGFVAGSALKASGDRDAGLYAHSHNGQKSRLQKALTKGPLGHMDKASSDKILGAGVKHGWRGAKWGAKKAGKGAAAGAGFFRDMSSEEGRKKRRAERERRRGQREQQANLAKEDARLAQHSGGWRGATMGYVAELAASVGGLWAIGSRSRKAVLGTAGGNGKPGAQSGRGEGYVPGNDEVPVDAPAGAVLPEVAAPSYIDEAEARQSDRAVKRRIESIRKAEPGQHAKVVEDLYTSSLDAHAAALSGGQDPDLTTPTDAGMYRQAVADKVNVSPGDLLVGYSGLAAVKWTENRDDMRRLSLEALQDPSLWFAEEYGARRDGETADQYLARRRITTLEAGYATVDGELCDAFSIMGLDINSPEDRERIVKWQAGAADALLDGFVIDLKDVDTGAVIRATQVANSWAQRRVTEVAQRRESYVLDLVASLDQARSSAPYFDTRLGSLQAGFTNALESHASLLERRTPGESDEAVWESWHKVEKAKALFSEAIADCSRTRQTVVVASAFVGEDVDELLGKAASISKSTADGLEALEEVLSSAIFDKEATADVLDKATRLSLGEQINLRSTVEAIEKLVDERLSAIDALTLDSSVRLQSGAERLQSTRHLVEGLNAEPVPV